MSKNIFEYNLGGVTFSSTVTTDENELNDLSKKNADVNKMCEKAFKKLKKEGKGFVAVFKNGNAFVDGGINIPTQNGKINNYLAYPVYMSDDIVYDELNGYSEINVYDYLKILQDKNPKLRIDVTMSGGTLWNEKINYWMNKLSKRR